jgi:hypothetical protein
MPGIIFFWMTGSGPVMKMPELRELRHLVLNAGTQLTTM